MANILIFTETSKESVKSVTLEILGKLKGHSLDVACFTELSETALSDLKKFGAKNIFKLNATGIEKYSPEGHANALKEFIKTKSYDYVFSGATSLTKDLLPRVSVSLDTGMISDVVEVNFEGDVFKGKRPLFAGKCLATVEFTGAKPGFVTIRPNALGLSDSTSAGEAKLEQVSVNKGEVKAEVKEVIKGKSEKLDLTEASIIVSGGRAMKNSENFKVLQELAEVIGATVGASRAAVDSGYADPSMQVGQTGKTVSPSLYIACGISGAIQHLAGMRTSKIIVAINTDPEAPIFSKADYGIVGDLFKVVPALVKEFKKLLNK